MNAFSRRANEKQCFFYPMAFATLADNGSWLMSCGCFKRKVSAMGFETVPGLPQLLQTTGANRGQFRMNKLFSEVTSLNKQLGQTGHTVCPVVPPYTLVAGMTMVQVLALSTVIFITLINIIIIIKVGSLCVHIFF